MPLTRIATATALCMIASAASAQTRVDTQYGELAIDGENQLLFKKRPFAPPIQGNNALTVVRRVTYPTRELVLLQDTGGSACPAQFHFVVVDARGARATAAFGTCSDLVTVHVKGETVLVAMPEFRGPFEPVAKGKPKQVSFSFDGVQLSGPLR